MGSEAGLTGFWAPSHENWIHFFFTAAVGLRVAFILVEGNLATVTSNKIKAITLAAEELGRYKILASRLAHMIHRPC